MKTILLALAGFAVHSATITSGTMNFTGQNYAPTFSFVTDEFDVTGKFRPGNQSNQCHPCVPGYSLRIWGSPGDGDFYSGTIGATPVEWDNSWSYSRFTWSGPSTAVINGPGTYGSTFSLDGRLCAAYTTSGRDDPCPALLADITGSGTVTANIVEGNGYLWLQSATFTFESQAAPVLRQQLISNPEPTAMLLSGIGLIAVVMVRRRIGN